MSREQRIAAAIRLLCDAAGITSDKRREALEDVLAKWIDELPTIEAEHAKDDRLYWVRLEDADGKRRAWRSRDRQFPWFVEGFASHYGDMVITVLGEVERDDDTPDTPDGPEILTSVEDFENAPENTVAALDEHYPIVKIVNLWTDINGRIYGPKDLVSSARSPIHVLRWGDSK